MKSKLYRSTQKDLSLTKEKGFSLIELLLASALFSIVVIAFFAAFIYGQEGTRVAGNRNRATLLAEEGLEAVRNMRDGGFSSLTPGTYGLSTNGGKWSFSGSSDVNDIYTRNIVISDVDANTKKISSNISWQQTLQRSGNLSLVTYLTNWTKTGVVNTAPKCVTVGNVSFYIPITPATSGNYPTAGDNSDSVTLTTKAPISEGYINVDMNFSGIPTSFTNVTLSMNFTDLDLKGDLGTGYRLDEAFTLMDKDGNTLVSLGASNSKEDNFVWTYPLSDGLFTGNSAVLLKSRYNAKVTLLSGSSVTVTKTVDSTINIQLCGYTN